MIANRLRPNPVFGPEYAIVRTALVDARERAEISQRTLARRLGRSQSHICMIERGQRRVDTLEFYALAKAAGCDPVELFSEIVHQLDAMSQALAAE